MGPHGSAGSAARALEQQALEALQWNWGEAYEITVTDGLWQARRRDGLGTIEASAPETLRREILDDYIARPAAREREIAPQPGTICSTEGSTGPGAEHGQ
jgi:hypothetical protein